MPRPSLRRLPARGSHRSAGIPIRRPASLPVGIGESRAAVPGNQRTPQPPSRVTDVSVGTISTPRVVGDPLVIPLLTSRVRRRAGGLPLTRGCGASRASYGRHMGPTKHLWPRTGVVTDTGGRERGPQSSEGGRCAVDRCRKAASQSNPRAGVESIVHPLLAACCRGWSARNPRDCSRGLARPQHSERQGRQGGCAPEITFVRQRTARGPFPSVRQIGRAHV